MRRGCLIWRGRDCSIGPFASARYSSLRLHPAAAVLLVFFAAQAAAQGTGLKLNDGGSPRLGATAPLSGEGPLDLKADNVGGYANGEVEAVGNAELRRGGLTVRADRLRYSQDSEEVEAVGDVHLQRDGDEMYGPRLRLRTSDAVGIIESPTFQLAPRTRAGSAQPVTGYGHAEALRIEPENRMRVTDAHFTTCKPGQSGWEIVADNLDLDFEHDVGKARDARFVFLGVSTPPVGYAEFSLNDSRKSGFLPPTFAPVSGVQGKTGYDFSLPYYWNIAPNYDATITTRYMQVRGVQFLTLERYLLPSNSGNINAELLPSDRQLETRRWGLSWQHYLGTPGGWSGNVNYNRVSDDNYLRDLSGAIALTSQTTIPQEASLTYGGGGWWNATTRVQQFQVLQDATGSVVMPYKRMPQILFNVPGKGLGPFDGIFAGEFVQFEHPTLQNGTRSFVYPQLALPAMTPAAYFTPKFGVHYTRYDLQELVPDTPVTLTRTVPITSVDSGVFLERDAKFGGRDVLQTIEPRLYYLYVPYRDQSAIPVFDTAVADFNYAQIFSENYYSGWDRISDANQLTAALTSRVIVPSTGQETLRALIGQRYYFRDQLVTIPGAPQRSGASSPYLFGLSGIVWPKWHLDFAAQVDSQTRQTQRLNAGLRFQPEPGKTLSIGYRFMAASLDTTPPPDGPIETRQTDIAFQWPLIGGWYAVGRYNRDIRTGKSLERLGGLEYNAGCWILRVAGYRFPIPSGGVSTSLFLQFEFNGFSRVGINPLETFKRNIPGYQRINQTSTDQSTANYFN